MVSYNNRHILLSKLYYDELCYYFPQDTRCIDSTYDCRLKLKIENYTLYNDVLRIARNLVETRENIKIESHPFYHINCVLIFMGIKQKIFFCKKKNPKWPFFKKGHFSKSPILKIFLWKFHGLVLGLVVLIDAKGIDVAQSIWP